MANLRIALAALAIVLAAPARGADPPGAFPPETTRAEAFAPAGRIVVNSPDAQGALATRLMIYALPNGNTIEQTLGCRMREGLDWHYDIQHVAAQVRLLRTLAPQERLVLVCAEAEGLSWPAWRGKHADANARIARLVADWRTRFGDAGQVTLTGHSGGGSFAFGLIEAVDDIPDYIDRIALLDSNYAFDGAKHADKLVRWLRSGPSRQLVVLAYDDREITFEGKKVVGPDGGTYRATGRMVEALGRELPFDTLESNPFGKHVARKGRVHFYVHPNPQNKILHTALVGDMNGLVHAQALGTPIEKKWGPFGGPRVYERYIPPEPMTAAAPPAKAHGAAIPPRPNDAPGGRAFMEQLRSLDRREREAAIVAEVVRGNIPDFLRKFHAVPVAAGDLRGVIEAAPDCLAVGDDDDFVRVPMTPQSAQQIADAFGCTLPTRKLVDAIDAAAEVRLAPQPLTEDRESIAAFLLSNEKIETERGGRPLGALTCGAKKDVVLSKLIHERPDRVAIYGWRQVDGKPIQPLTTVHVNWYVDYSHGVRLVRDAMTVDGEPARVTELLVDPQRCALVSDEGPVDPPRYPSAGDGN
jgi:hypothetical protein